MGRWLEEEERSSPLEEASTSTVMFIKGQPTISAVGPSNALQKETLATLQDVSRASKGMQNFPSYDTSEDFMKGFGNLSSHGLGSRCSADEERQAYTTLCNMGLIQEGINTHSFAPLLSCMQHEELWCKDLGSIMHDVPSPKDVLSLALLDSCGFKGLVEWRPFL